MTMALQDLPKYEDLYPPFGFDDDFVYKLRRTQAAAVKAWDYWDSIALFRFNLLTKEGWAQTPIQNIELLESEANTFENYETLLPELTTVSYSDDHKFFFFYRFFLADRAAGDEDFVFFYAINLKGPNPELEKLEVNDLDGTLKALIVAEELIQDGNLTVIYMRERRFYFILRGEQPLCFEMVDRIGRSQRAMRVFHICQLEYNCAVDKWEWSMVSRRANNQLATTEDHSLRRVIDGYADCSSHNTFAIHQRDLIVILPSAITSWSNYLDKVLIFDVKKSLFQLEPILPDQQNGFPAGRSIEERLAVRHQIVHWPIVKPLEYDFFENEDSDFYDENYGQPSQKSYASYWVLKFGDNVPQWQKVCDTNSGLNIAEDQLVHGYFCFFFSDTAICVCGGSRFSDDIITEDVVTIQIQPKSLQQLAAEIFYANNKSGSSSRMPCEFTYSDFKEPREIMKKLKNNIACINCIK